MQERRTTIRVRHVCRTPYCPGEDLLPREGRLTTLSERGAGILVREAHQAGERLTVNVPLPEEPDPLTITGVVRWSSEPIPNNGWHPLGVEWLPLEESARHRLQQFLHVRARTSSPREDEAAAARRRARRLMAQRSGIVAGTSLVIAGALWAFSLRGDNQALVATLHQRESAITQLKRHEAVLQQELGATKQSLAATTEEIARLDQQAQLLGDAVAHLHQDVEDAHASLGSVHAQREELMQRVLDLTHERTYLMKRVEDAQRELAIQDAIRTRAALGNQGYVVREPPPQERPTLWIRVHDPEASVSGEAAP
jgi:hypothetical protein